MRSKLMTGALVGTIGFLLATNPVVVDAAGQITSGQIKNNTIKSNDIKNNQIKSADIKNGAIQTVDLATDAVPRQISALRRLAFEGGSALANGTKVFASSVTVTVDGTQAVVLDATLMVDHNSGANSVDLSACLRPAGSLGTPTDFDSVNFFDVNASVGADTIYPVQGSAVPAAGSYEVGPCINPFSGTNVLTDVAGTVMVIDATTVGPLGRAHGSGDRPGRN